LGYNALDIIIIKRVNDHQNHSNGNEDMNRQIKEDEKNFHPKPRNFGLIYRFKRKPNSDEMWG